MLTEEVQAKTAKNVTMRTNLARFPFTKGLDAFDFAYQPSLDKKQIERLGNCHFVEHGENIVILGPPGVGKTHLAVALGLKAIEAGYRVLFTTAANVIAVLSKALNEGRLDDKLKVFTVRGCSSSMKSDTCRSSAKGRTCSSSSSAVDTSEDR